MQEQDLAQVQVECFSFVADDGSEYRWVVTFIWWALASGKIKGEALNIALTDELYAHALRNGIEEPRVAQVDEERLQVPLLLVAMPDGSHVLLDGSHRVAKAYRLGRKTMWAWSFTLAQLEPFQIGDE